MIPGNVASPLTAMPREALLRMAAAGNATVDCMADLHRTGSNLVSEVLRGHDEFSQWEHYPPNDSCDPESRAQYYFHAHSPDDRDNPDFGHFHTFMRSGGMPPGVRPALLPNRATPSGEGDHVCHLIAISMNPSGFPERLFTTNRWVTGETWYEAPDVIFMLDRFTVATCSPPRSLDRWLTAMIVLFRPQIEQLLTARDRVVDMWHKRHPDRDVFEDRRLEITSSIDISIQAQLEVLDRILEGRSTEFVPQFAS